MNKVSNHFANIHGNAQWCISKSLALRIVEMLT